MVVLMFEFLLDKLVGVPGLNQLDFDEILLDKLAVELFWSEGLWSSEGGFASRGVWDKIVVAILLEKLGKDKLFSVGPKRKTIKRRMIHPETLMVNR